MTESPLAIVRAYQPDDQAAFESLERRVQPYRPEDAAHVEAMYLRAAEAQQSGDPRWMAPISLPARPFSEEFDAFWVAEAGTEVVGMIGGQTFDGRDVMPESHPLAAAWRSRGDVAELRRLRVAPEARRQGFGERLSVTVIEWARSAGFRLLVVNTTTAQLPALQLYRKVGFRDAGLSFVGRYELTWLEMQP